RRHIQDLERRSIIITGDRGIGAALEAETVGRQGNAGHDGECQTANEYRHDTTLQVLLTGQCPMFNALDIEHWTLDIGHPESPTPSASPRGRGWLRLLRTTAKILLQPLANTLQYAVNRPFRAADAVADFRHGEPLQRHAEDLLIAFVELNQ